MFLPVVMAALVVWGFAWCLEALARPQEVAFDAGEQAVTITLWHAYKGDKGQAMDDFVAEFQAAYPDITVETEVHPSSRDLFDAAMAAIKAGGETPDLAVGWPNQMWNFARFDALRFLDEFASDPNPNVGLDAADYYAASLQENRLPEYEDQLGGLPLAHSALGVLFYNADLLTTAALTVPQTWDEFYTACMSLTTETVSGTVLRLNESQFINLLWTHGGAPYSADLKRARFNGPAGVEALDLYLTLMDEGYARMEAYSWEQQDAFARGEAAFIVGTSTQIPFMRDRIAAEGVVNQWGVARLPADPGHEAVMDAGPNIVVMRATPEEERAAWLFVRWLTLREQNARFAARMDYYPVRISASTHPSLTQKLADEPQYAQALGVQAEWGRGQPILLGLIEVYAEIQSALDAILHDRKPLTGTLDLAAANVDAILALTGPDAATITPAGGVLVYTNTLGLATTTLFPAGALATTTTVAYVPLTDLPSDGLSFALVPNLELNKPATVTVNYRDEDVAGMDEAQLRFYNYDWPSHAWVDADPCGGYVRDTANNVLSASICHFSDHGLMDWAYKAYLPLVVRPEAQGR